MTEAEIRAELQAILTEAEHKAELVGAILELLAQDANGAGDPPTRAGIAARTEGPGVAP